LDDSPVVEPRPAPAAEPRPDPALDAELGWRAELVDAVRRAHPLVLAAVGLFALLVAIGRLIAHTGVGAVVTGADVAVLRWIAGLRTPDLDAASVRMSDVATTNTTIIAGLVVAIVASVVLRRVWPAVLMAAALVGELVVFLDSATLVARPRPPVPHLDPVLPPTTSFPSGHTAAAVCLYGGLATIVVLTARGWWRWLVVALAVLAVLAVAFARVYRAAHHPSDVLAGALLGVLWLVVVTRTVRPREHLAPNDRDVRRVDPDRGPARLHLPDRAGGSGGQRAERGSRDVLRLGDGEPRRGQSAEVAPQDRGAHEAGADGDDPWRGSVGPVGR
jgi:undecaprenyl-diphosphatase